MPASAPQIIIWSVLRFRAGTSIRFMCPHDASARAPMMICARWGHRRCLSDISPVSQGRLYPEVSGGLGFLALLVVLLVNVQPPGFHW